MKSFPKLGNPADSINRWKPDGDCSQACASDCETRRDALVRREWPNSENIVSDVWRSDPLIF
ncbi:hypothetical protein SAMN05444158_3852 [Bradyrhizobium canariense]|uniref:Uncharacterized protein n=1 Tax=Bradyrhizobium canariense TaxID=255045 RepID=A0A1H1WJK6_9BRAD|nr:hypothetical protein SAMN05444158_3852 [Bradyrhizobium canariense]